MADVNVAHRRTRTPSSIAGLRGAFGGNLLRAESAVLQVFHGSGDGGNRTRVRDRARGGFYERSRRSDLVPRSPRRRGSPGPAPWSCPRFGGSGPPRVSRLLIRRSP